MSKFSAFVPVEKREFPAMKKWLESFKEMWKRNHHPDSKTETLDVNDIERLIAMASRPHTVIKQCCREDEDGMWIRDPAEYSDTDRTLAVIYDDSVCCMECGQILHDNEGLLSMNSSEL